MKKLLLIALSGLCLLFSSCSKEESTDEPMLIIKFKFDPNQVRLNNLGQPATIPAGHAAQSPQFNQISAHYVEFAPNANTQLGSGSVVYHAPETVLGGSTAIDFDQAKVVTEGETFLKIPLSQLNSGTYEWLRVSLSYQNYQINIRHQNVDYQGTLASFIGINNYISSFSIGNNFFDINGNRPQGFWAFAINNQPYSASGQAPANATTVPNPLASTSPIPAGSCVVTGKFPTNLIITGSEKNDVVVTLNLSINNSFEWQEVTSDGKFEPSIGENVVDMGIRGLIPTFVK
ncbi:hypothetical protein [Flavobacterium capsici]|uniref:Lipoprotein n=1 Tax=Flavobacterium capsici TaxID=3075618 RepID=A0AA96EWM5_9FLAO|nr:MULTISPECIES: hypothetical protein [unclassified Flavobacterium]WNM19551.1 hypothetical protein RN608_02435 [Flavobacterium sp. PMR2A8]WNM20940.1 hypothetical protein RN605_09605 [Flavobacterium sp. PMTSA4]